MPDSKKFLHPEALQRISRLQLRARHVVEGFLSGMHRSPYFGQSVEFRSHREYAPGDDLRHVDWKVWAKQDRYYVKQFEEDTNMRCTLLVDVSASMRYGNGPLTKYEYGCTIAASLAYLLLRQQDAVGCASFDEDVRKIVPLRSKRNHLNDIVDTMATDEPAEKTDLGRVLARVAESYPPRGMMVLISDLLTDLDPLVKGLRVLRQLGHDVMVFHVMDDDELEFPFNGPTRFEGLESLDFLNCNPRALRQGYLEALDRFLSDARRRCAQNAVDYRLIPTSEPLDAALTAYLSNRLGMHHRN
ncbi:MAG: DUF58 domain-containing protein [Planctomycetota bacterium]|nr:MAG: DUF58 domain-containing protein [Planctomycetota bacterium]REJ90970.1 MAG: DUF58 domain-containing protein [Planctomycetota bacterium]REK25452.1 MAG: DUF58 domain-containing protein [Planctomycetota bacterium]REK40844.1 MAG: DUF58 domain-containing protein [Planctomycetota bacterium]